MAYDEKLDERITKIVSPWKKTGKRLMFGGVCYLMNGNMVGRRLEGLPHPETGA